MKMIKTFIITLVFFISLFFNSYANQSVEDIIKGRKAMFSENYQNAKRISTLLKSGKIDEAKPLMEKFNDLMIIASDDMIKLAGAIDTAEDLKAIQKELMWSNCSACHNRFRAPH